MKTKLLLTALVLAFFSLSGFAQKKPVKLTPIDYNDQMADITDSLYRLGQAWGGVFNEAYKGDKNFTKLTPVRKNMVEFIDLTTAKLKREPLVGKGGEGLRTAVIDFLKFEKDMIDIAFIDIEKLSSSSSQAEIEAALKKLTDQAEKEGDVLKKVNAAQEDYGRKNGFAIESAKESE
jgi:hypothetical protein